MNINAQAPADTLLIRRLLNKADSLCEVNPHEALTYSQKAVRSIPGLDDPVFISKVYQTHAKVFFRKALYDSAEVYTKKSIMAFPREESKHLAELYNNHGAISMMQNQFDTSLFYLHKSYAINNKLNIQKGLLSNYSNFGSVYRRMGLYDISTRYIYKG